MKMQVNNAKSIIANDGPIKAEIEITDLGDFWVTIGHIGESALIMDQDDWIKFYELVKEVNDSIADEFA